MSHKFTKYDTNSVVYLSMIKKVIGGEYMKISKKLLALGLGVSLVLGNLPIVNAATSTVSEIKGKDRYETAAKIAEKQTYTSAILSLYRMD